MIQITKENFLLLNNHRILFVLRLNMIGSCMHNIKKLYMQPGI